MNGKVKVFFGPPMSILTENEGNTMEISGRLNRTAERYLEMRKHHGVELSDVEKACLTYICDFGFMSPLEIRELPDEVLMTDFEAEGLDKKALSAKLNQASFADLVVVVDALGF
jgi:hypothetical protein